VLDRDPAGASIGLKDSGGFTGKGPKLRYIQVQRVIDGDTIEDTHGEKYRLAAIDAPEGTQPFGPEAAEHLAMLLSSKDNNIRVRRLGVDRYGRTLATVYNTPPRQRIDINKQMVADGFAWAYDRQKATDKSIFMRLEATARRNRLGLWVQLNHNLEPELPRDYRRRRKYDISAGVLDRDTRFPNGYCDPAAAAGTSSATIPPHRRGDATEHPVEVSLDEAREAGEQLGVNFHVVPIERLRAGMIVELEHDGRRGARTDVTHGNLVQTARIALAHLQENPGFEVANYRHPDYYEMLKAMEEKSELAWKRWQGKTTVPPIFV
jgi:endonuclease YncB( thermonuclease family)